MKVLRHLEPAAAAERDIRAAHYPDYVARKLLPEADAQADYEAWCAIARWCAGERIDWTIEVEPETLQRWDEDRAMRAAAGDRPGNWELMEMAAARAVAHLRGLCERSPDNVELAGRRARIEAIHGGLQCARAFYARMNAELRRRAKREAEAA